MSADTDPLFAARGGTPMTVDLGMVATNGNINVAMLDAAKAMGATWVRGSPEWGFHATKAAFTTDVTNAGASGVWPALAQYQSDCAYAHSLGLKVLGKALGALAWARGLDTAASPFHQAILPTERTSFAELGRQILLAGADALEVTNEPNLAGEYMFSSDHPRFAFPNERNDDYVLLMQAVYTRCKADPLVSYKPVGIGAPGIAGHEQLPDAPGLRIHPTTWYQKLLDGSARADNRTTPISVVGFFDFASVHPYADAAANAGPIAWNTQWLVQPGDAVYWHGVASLQRIRQALVAAGVGSKKLWATELGAPTGGGAGSISEATQAQWMREYIQSWFSRASSGFSGILSPTWFGAFTGPMFVYQWRDLSDGIVPPTNTQGFYGMQRYDGSSKPALPVFISAAAGRRGSVL